MDRKAKRAMWMGGAALILISASSTADAQSADGPASAPAVCTRRGPIHRMFHHAAHTVQDTFVGYPDAFVEPPLGHYVNEQFAVQVAKANTHRFTLYRSDFLPGTSQFSPSGASRFNVMATRIPGWMGPIMIEWTPDQPAAARRAAVARPWWKRCKGRAAGAGRPRCDRALAVPRRDGSRGHQSYGEHHSAQRWLGSDVPLTAERNGQLGSSLR